MPTSIPVSGSSDASPAPHSLRRRSPWRDVLMRLACSRGAVLGGTILVVLILAAVGAPLLTGYDPLTMQPDDRLQPPNRHHLFGTDVFGRDLFTRILYGSRISLRTGVISISLAMTLGVPLGLTSGFYGGGIDRLLMRIADLMLTFPGILLALVIIAILDRTCSTRCSPWASPRRPPMPVSSEPRCYRQKNKSMWKPPGPLGARTAASCCDTSCLMRSRR